MRLKVNVYNHSNRGQGHWFSPSNPSNPGTGREIPISIRTTEYAIDRTGVTSAFTWNVGGHDLEAGLWYEDNGHSVQRNFYYIDGPVTDDFFLPTRTSACGTSATPPLPASSTCRTASACSMTG